MKRIVFLVVAGMLVTAVVWSAQPEKGVGVPEFTSFLKDYEAKMIPLSEGTALAYFNATISGKDADYQKWTDIQVELKKLHSDTSAFAKVKAFHDGGQITDPLLKRQLDIIYLSYLGNQIEPKMLEELVARQTAIEKKFNVFRAKVGDRTLSDNQVDSILRNSKDSRELETTWTASKQIGRAVAADLIELAKLRNRAAKSLGFANYYEMQLKLGEQDPAEIASLFNQLDSLTRGAFLAAKDEVDTKLAAQLGLAKNQLRPWHYQNRFFQEAPKIYSVNLDAFFEAKDPVAISRAYFAGIGLPVDSILARSDLYEKPGKYQHAYSTDIDHSGDVRIVCNVRPDYNWMGTMLHELGHSVYGRYNDPAKPWILRDAAHSFTTEAIAEFFGRLAASPQWLVQVAGVPKADVDKVAKDCAQSLRLEQLIFSRWAQVMVRFERALYENPDQDLNKLWWDLVEKYQGLNRPENRNEPDWASKIHIATVPVYYHNYLLGELLASQFADAIGRKVLGSADPFSQSFAGDPKIGKFLVDNVFHPGMVYPWNEMIERATGQKLTPIFYARQFIGTK